LIAVHVLFMGWTIFNAHYPALFIPGLLFFLGFAQVTAPFQNIIDLKPPLLVGFFLGGLVVHGGVQGWWIEPVLGKLSVIPLMPGARIVSYLSAEFLLGPHLENNLVNLGTHDEARHVLEDLGLEYFQ
jgi:hypothetical protein